MPKECIFCGRTQRQTKEHAVPLWFAKLKPANYSVRVEGEHRNIRKWNFLSDKVELKVRGCCTRCNSGWMSDLEQEAKPVLLPLVAGAEVHLPGSAQSVIARWAIKTVMVLEFSSASSRGKYYSQTEREALRAGRLPGSTLVFLAGYRGQHAFQATEHPLTFSDTARTFPGYSSTTTFGSLVLQVLSYRERAGSRWFKVSGNFDKAEVQVWPIRGEVLWPPEEVFEDDALESYATRWIVNKPEHV